MSFDVSLCIIRIESGHEKLSLEDKKDVKKPNVITVFRGRRKKCEITIDTIPQEGTDMCDVKPVLNQNDKKELIQFVCGNPFVEKITGILHLFKEDDLTNLDRAANRSQTVCILAVPTTMNCTDLLTFMAPCKDEIKHVRIIKDGSPNQYMALITFRSPESVAEFYKSFNGIPFSTMEPEWCCHLVFVSRIETLSEEEGGSVAPVAHTELPTCPVCLERMDESVDGILTIMCNHAFHGQCLAKWGDTSCPVCRYVQTPEPEEDNFCLECLSTESLWICLICGHVGCGRYVQGHAYQHYIDTHHCYSMQLGSNSVWDYVGDNFVHRILQNKADGKLVQGTDPEKSAEAEAKLEAIQLEYSYLLTSQLESQRVYYEDLIASLEIKSAAEMAKWKTKSDNADLKETELTDKINALTKDKIALEKKIQSTTNKLASLQKQLEEEKDLNSAMRKNQSDWEKRYKELLGVKIAKDLELIDLKEQLRDVMFFLEAEKTVQMSPHKDELQEGKIEVGPKPSTSKSNRGRKSH